MTTFAGEVLRAFAAVGYPASRFEVYGNDRVSAVTSAISELAADGYLEPLPTSETCDEYGGTRYRLTAKGRANAPANAPEPLSKLRQPGKRAK